MAEAAVRGDEDAFAELYDLLAPRVFNLVLGNVREHSTAEDICQEVWLKAHRQLPSLRSASGAQSWMLRIAKRACLDYFRSRVFRDRGSPALPLEWLDSPSRQPELVALRRGDLRLVCEALAALPPRQGIALYLKRVEGKSHAEVADLLGCSRSAVMTLLHRARHGFVSAYQRLDADAAAICDTVAALLMPVVEGQATPLQRRALEAHVSECSHCRHRVAEGKRNAAGIASLEERAMGTVATIAPSGPASRASASDRAA